MTGKDLIDPLIPLLRQDAGAMSHGDEAVLWDGYNRPSKLVAPATDESLEITDSAASGLLASRARPVDTPSGTAVAAPPHGMPRSERGIGGPVL